MDPVPPSHTRNAVCAILIITAVDACLTVYRIYLSIYGNGTCTCDFKGNAFN